MADIIKPKRPTGPGWHQLPRPHQWASSYPTEFWFHAANMLSVITAVEVANDGDGIDKGPEYHISISTPGPDGKPARVSSADALWVLAQFGVDGAEEDNHVPNGAVRNFWRPVADRLVGLECACKADEPEIREDKGDFIWRGVTK